jgi:uncharacterized protein with GYD domain
MPTYLSLVTLTDQGVRDLRGAPDRMRQWDQRIRAAGVNRTVYYVTMGEYDWAIVWEAPDDTTISRELLALSTEGNVRAKTLKLLSREEFEKILP